LPVISRQPPDVLDHPTKAWYANNLRADFSGRLEANCSGEWVEDNVEDNREEPRKKRKGCDLGYALARYSCERVAGVDACTVTALDVITAFAVPDPG